MPKKETETKADNPVETPVNETVLTRAQRQEAAERRRENKIRRAAENGSFVLQIHSGDEIFSLVSLIPQLDRGVSIIQQGTRRFAHAEVQAYNERLVRLVDEVRELTEEVCKKTGLTFRVPRPLQIYDKLSIDN